MHSTQKNNDAKPQAQLRDLKLNVQQARTIRDKKAGELANVAKAALDMWAALPWVFDFDEQEEKQVKRVLEWVFGKIVEMEVPAEARKPWEELRKATELIEGLYHNLKDVRNYEEAKRETKMNTVLVEFERSFGGLCVVVLNGQAPSNEPPVGKIPHKARNVDYGDHFNLSTVGGNIITNKSSSDGSRTTTFNNRAHGGQNINYSTGRDQCTGRNIRVSTTTTGMDGSRVPQMSSHWTMDGNSRSSSYSEFIPLSPCSETPTFVNSSPAASVESFSSCDPENPFSDAHAYTPYRRSTQPVHRNPTFFANASNLTIDDVHYPEIGPDGIMPTPRPGHDQVNWSGGRHPSFRSTINSWNEGTGVQTDHNSDGVSDVSFGRNQNVNSGAEGFEVNN
ncbi:hypothetical protein AAF712_011957 [Marasmius tenuissimus]|uniref:NACHT-NTPase and P-loop NTPases N-terminal domain-containing protein n=1 Tax=Marasmius tenuissimus TaxID=585030 RepID=A0ABR2ZJQ5_9AGAR